MKKEERDILLKKFDVFDLEEDFNKKRQLQNELVEILKNKKKLDSNDYQLWGLIYYSPADSRISNLKLALEKFQIAYDMNSENFMACLYVAHCYHDKKEYDNALKYYLLVDQNDLKIFQLWRYVKLIEQIGCCYYKIGKENIGRKYFIEVLDLYKKNVSIELAVPVELLECLADSDEIVREIKKIEDYLE